METERKSISGSGLCYWVTRDENGNTLHISGTGRMPDFTNGFYDGTPWMFEHVTNLIVHDGVTYVGNYSFRNEPRLASVSLPPSLKYMGKGCFEGCESLRRIIIPEGVGFIPKYAFYRCNLLEEAVLPKSVTVIHRYAFAECTSLKRVNITRSVTGISSTAFLGVDLSCLDVDSSLFRIEDGSLYRADTLIAGARNREKVTVSEGTRIINTCAFYENKTVVEVYLPEGVRLIEREAFAYCSNLKKVFFTGYRPETEEESFKDCSAMLCSLDKPTVRKDTERLKVATTRRGYAILDNGKVYFSADTVNTGVYDFNRRHDVVDIRGGFDFVIGLCADGSMIYAAYMRDTSGDMFSLWNSIGGYADIVKARLTETLSEFAPGGGAPYRAIAASECRAAVITCDGIAVQSGEVCMDQSRLGDETPRAKAIDVGFDNMLYIDMDDRVVMLPARHGRMLETINSHIRLLNETAVDCREYNPYYSHPTVGVLTNSGRLVWTDDSVEGDVFVSEPGFVRFAVGSHIAAAIDREGRVTVFFADGDKEMIPADDRIADLDFIHNERLIMLTEYGEVIDFDLRPLLNV